MAGLEWPFRCFHGLSESRSSIEKSPLRTAQVPLERTLANLEAMHHLAARDSRLVGILSVPKFRHPQALLRKEKGWKRALWQLGSGRKWAELNRRLYELTKSYSCPAPGEVKKVSGFPHVYVNLSSLSSRRSHLSLAS